MIVSGAESEDNVRERNELASNKSNKAYPSSSKLSDGDKSSEKIDVDVFEQPKVLMSDTGSCLPLHLPNPGHAYIQLNNLPVDP